MEVIGLPQPFRLVPPPVALPLLPEGGNGPSILAPGVPPSTFPDMKPHAIVPTCVLTVMLAVTLRAQEQRYFDWTALPFPAEEFAARRETFATRLATMGDGVMLIPSIDGVSGGETFRQQDTFMYFTGLELPRSILAIGSDGDVMLFAPPRDPRFENRSRTNDFPGRPLADDPVLVARSGIGAIRSTDEFEALVSFLVEEDVPIYLDMGSPGDVPTPRIRPHLNWDAHDNFYAYLRERHPQATLVNAFPLVAAQRMVKSRAEIERMRATARITSEAIMIAGARVHPDVDERTLEAVFEGACKEGGAQRLSFSSIIKSGPNSLWPWRVLASHYDRRNRAMEAGDLVIFDVGCELDGYVSDVGRTFPVSGSFNDEQRGILEMVIGVTDAIIAAIRPGTTFRALREVGQRTIPREHRRYMMVGNFYGHHLGLSTGDPSLLDAPLEPGMIFTVEPWYYNHDIAIAVFIEEEVLVTSDGAEVLTAALPRTPDELEAVVRRR